jgi:argininosuccinate lyase
MIVMKGQPLTFNRDNQEDKEPLFDSIDTVKSSLAVFAGMLPTLTVKRDNMHEAARSGYSTATDLADYLVRKGTAFRDAHEAVGRAVRLCVESDRELAELSLDELQTFSPHIEADVFQVLTVEGSVAARDHLGGTAPAQVRKAVARARRQLQQATG